MTKNSLKENFKTYLGLAAKFLLMNFYYRIEKFVILASKECDQAGKKLLDIGAGSSPYKKYFKKIGYFAQDIKQNKNIDYAGDVDDGLSAIASASFDYILCTQVLEHLKEPPKAFQEFSRILKPGGKIFLTTNFIYQLHSVPDDYYRFTKFGLKYLGQANGFAVERLKPQGGIFSVLSYILATLPIRLFLERSKALYWLYLILFSVPIVLINLIACVLDFLDRNKKMTINYEVIYRKI